MFAFVFVCTMLSTVVPKNSLLPVWSPCVCVLMIVVHRFVRDRPHALENGRPPKRKFGVDQHHAGIGDERRGVAAAERSEVATRADTGTRDDEQVVLDLLNFAACNAFSDGGPCGMLGPR
jgi:hypothetical protein